MTDQPRDSNVEPITVSQPPVAGGGADYMRALTDEGWYQLAFLCAGIGSGAVMELAPDVTCPTEVIKTAVVRLLEGTYGIRAPRGYR